jgi:DNA-binding transcriptional LysR family regulator
MELRHLRYFVAAAEEENISRAAPKLHVSQPGISRQIRNLEEEIGFPLFERSGKAVRLTPAGKIFFGEARDILQRVADAVKKTRSLLPPQAVLNVGYAPSATVEILPRALRAFKIRYPGVRVNLHDLSAKDMLPQLRQKKLDLALTLPPSKLPRELNMKELERYETCVAVGKTHPLAKSKYVSLNQIATEPIAALIRKDYPQYHSHLQKLFATIGRKPRIGSELDSGTSLMAAVEAGREITFLPSSVSRAVGPRLKLLKVRPAIPPWSIVALWRKDHETELVRAFVAAA